jgi:hypothetical protein
MGLVDPCSSYSLELEFAQTAADFVGRVTNWFGYVLESPLLLSRAPALSVTEYLPGEFIRFDTLGA